MSITPSVTQAKVGDTVVFTIVAQNYGPGPADYMWVNADVTGDNPGYVNCGGVNQPAPPLGTYGADGSACEVGSDVPSGSTITDSLVTQVQPTTAGHISETACPIAPEGPLVDNTSVGCKTAMVTVDGATCTVGMPGGTQTLGDATYSLEGADTFTNNAPLGSFASTDPNQVIYTGDHGMGWTEYPDGWPSTNSGSFEGYSPSTVQSVHGGVLDFYLHNENDSHDYSHPVGASISPLPSGNRYQAYGAWSFCERVPPDYLVGPRPTELFGFHEAPLLWPMDNPTSPTPPSLWQSAESDFPESDLAESALDFTAYAHYGGQGAQDIFDIQSKLPLFDPYQWHVYTQTWEPGSRGYYVDGTLVGTSTSQVYSQPERWQLQFEPASPSGTPWGSAAGPVPVSGHVWVKWVWIGTLN
ncbi:MAG: hypothetical protein ACXVUE_13255 [Solirubrobacteraceae bacterium]